MWQMLLPSAQRWVRGKGGEGPGRRDVSVECMREEEEEEEGAEEAGRCAALLCSAGENPDR